MILLKSSENYTWPWNTAGEQAETVFAAAYPALYHHCKQYEDTYASGRIVGVMGGVMQTTLGSTAYHTRNVGRRRA